jgi:hypothetical protein
MIQRRLVDCSSRTSSFRSWQCVLLTSVMLLLASISGWAEWNRQNQPLYPQGQGYGSNYIPEGTRFVVLLDDKLETSKLKEGKQFKAKLGEDLTAPNGETIPRGKKLKAHISRVESGIHGRILMAFDSIETRHGWVPIAATVVGVPGEHAVKTSNEGEIEKAGVNKKRVAEGALAGAAVGAGTGAVVGGVHGAVIGAGVGAAVGGTTGLLTDRNMTLNKGQQLEIQLDRPLQVPSR